MAEGHRLGFATVFAADAYFQASIGGATLFYGDAHETAYTDPVDNLERVVLEDLLIQVDGDEGAPLVGGDAPPC